MRTCSPSCQLILSLIYSRLLPIFGAEQGEVQHEVIGNVGHDVLLPCFNDKPNTSFIQSQWDLLNPDGSKTRISVSSIEHGEDIPQSPLKERVKNVKQSLQIKDVSMADAGSYICTVITFPAGSFEEITKLVVQEQRLWPAGIVYATASAVVLLILIPAAVMAYVVVRRRDSAVRLSVNIDTSGPGVGAARQSVRDQDIVYTDLKFKSPRDTSPSPKDEARRAEDVTYSDIRVLHQQAE